MPTLTVLPIRTPREQRIFLTFRWRIYRNDPLWVPPLLPDLRERIDPARGVFFKRGGQAEFFIAWQDGQPVGTICAGEDCEMNAQRGVKECVFGFFESVHDNAVMEALIAAARSWAVRRGLNTLVGPFHLDYEDAYGILVEGRDRPAALMCGHTPPYYMEFFERSGFRPLRGDNIAFALDITTDTPAMQDLTRMAERVRQRGRYSVRSADFAHWEDELERVYRLLNTALSHLPDFRPWPKEVVFNSLAPFRTIADPDLILFAMDGPKTIGWLPGLPNLNEAFIHVNGLRYPWEYLRLVWQMRRKFQCLTLKSVLVPQEYWGSGAAFLLFDEMLKRARARGYRWIDASLTSEDNPRTPALGARFGATIYKRYRVYSLPI